MKKGVWIAIAVVVVLVIIGALYLVKYQYTPTPLEKNSGTTSGQGTVAGQGSIISISGFKFNPATVNIAINESVTWNNEDSANHKIVSDSGSELDSENLANGQSYTHTFNTAGTYDYHCSIHPTMKGKVVVS